MLNLDTLNPEQRDAVETIRGPVLILAGAGTGKTRVITFRIAHMVERGIAPDNILAVTFTNKAAREMLSRLSGMLPINTRGMWIGTFHGLCNRMLRAHFRDAGLPQTFAILWTLQRACEIQMATLSMGAPIPVSEAIAAKCTRDALQFNPHHGAGQDVFDALVRLVDRMDTSYRH